MEHSKFKIVNLLYFKIYCVFWVCRCWLLVFSKPAVVSLLSLDNGYRFCKKVSAGITAVLLFLFISITGLDSCQLDFTPLPLPFLFCHSH